MADTSTRNPLAGGFYTVREAAQLIERGNYRRIVGWLNGYRGREVGPLLKRDYKPIHGVQELSFHDLLEVRFVEFFRAEGIGVRSLRESLKNARQVFGIDKPFASLEVKYRSEGGKDGKGAKGQDILVEEIFKPAAEKTGDKKLWSLVTKNFVDYETIRQTLDAGVVFDPATQLAKLWRPRAKRFPEVFIDPKVAYGRPVVPSSFPTRTLYESWIAEDKDFGAVADWFEVPPGEVHMAIEFEKYLEDEWRGRVAAN